MWKLGSKPNGYIRLSNRTPRHRNQNPTLHLLNQRHSLMNRISPSLHIPALLPAHLPFLQIRKLPEMMHRIQLSNLHEPGTYTLHYFSPGFEASAPVGFPFEEIAWVEGVGAEFEDAAELAGGGGGPEGKFLH